MMEFRKESTKLNKYSKVLREVKFYLNGEEYPILIIACDVVHRAGGYFVGNSQTWGATRTDKGLTNELHDLAGVKHYQRESFYRGQEQDFIANHNLPDFAHKGSHLGSCGWGSADKASTTKKARVEFRLMIEEAIEYLNSLEEEFFA